MPFEVRLHPSHRLAVVRLSGAVNGDDVLSAIDALLAGGWALDWASVADARAAGPFRMTAADLDRIRAIVVGLDLRGPGGKTAFLVGGDDADLAARRLIGATALLTERAQRVHYTAGAAAEWLGVPVELLDSAG